MRQRKGWNQEGENEGGEEKWGEQLFTIIIIILIHYPPNYWISNSKRGGNTLDSTLNIKDSSFLGVVLMAKCTLLINWKLLVISDTEPRWTNTINKM